MLAIILIIIAAFLLGAVYLVKITLEDIIEGFANNDEDAFGNALLSLAPLVTLIGFAGIALVLL